MRWMWSTVGKAVSPEPSPGWFGWITARVIVWLLGLWLKIMV